MWPIQGFTSQDAQSDFSRARRGAAQGCRRSTSNGSGGLRFVQDGHHRVSVARHHGHEVIEAYVTEVQTRVGPGERLKVADPGQEPRAALPRTRPASARSAKEDQLQQAEDAWSADVTEQLRALLD